MALNLKEGEYLGAVLEERESAYFKLTKTVYAPDCRIAKHYHDNNYLSILTKGLYQEKNQRSCDAITPGEVLYRPSSYDHENTFATGGGACFNIELKPALHLYLEKKNLFPATVTKYRSGAVASLYRLLASFQHHYQDDLALELLCDWIFQAEPKVQARQPWLQKAVSILEHELGTFHSLEQLSERVFVHPVYLSRAFKARLGMTVTEYQLQSKLTNAFAQLLNTEVPVSDISQQNGFYDDAHFIRAFKATYKVSPHQFRLRARS